MEVLDSFPRARPKCSHTAVAHRGRFLIKWFANPEPELPSPAILIYAPSSRNAIPLRITRDTAPHAERRQCCVVEGNGLVEIVGTKVDVTKHGYSPYRPVCRMRSSMIGS